VSVHCPNHPGRPQPNLVQTDMEEDVSSCETLVADEDEDETDDESVDFGGESGEGGGESNEEYGESEEDEDDAQLANDPIKLKELEELRHRFREELKDPSAWILQRVKNFIQSKRTFAAREVVRKWWVFVAVSTGVTAEGELQLPYIGRPGDGMPFHRALTWEEFEARGYVSGRDIEEGYKWDASLTILFLFPEAQTKGLSVGEKKRMFTIASRLWSIDHLRAEALLWVLTNEYAYAGREDGAVCEWPNSMAEDFMMYTALYPPPIVASYSY
jgi:hypothetical protein